MLHSDAKNLRRICDSNIQQLSKLLVLEVTHLGKCRSISVREVRKHFFIHIFEVNFSRGVPNSS